MANLRAWLPSDRTDRWAAAIDGSVVVAAG